MDHQRGQYYEHCNRSIVPREWKGKQRMSAPPFIQSAGRGDLPGGGPGKKDPLNSSNMQDPIRTRKGPAGQVGWKRQA